MVAQIIRSLGTQVGLDLPAVEVTGTDPILPSVFKVGTAAAATVGAVTAAVALFQRKRPDNVASASADPVHIHPATGGGQAVVSEPAGGSGPAVITAEIGSRIAVDVREAAIAFRDERYFRVDGDLCVFWAPLSGDYRTAEGWVRLHCNFDHHRDAALRALGLPSGAGRAEVSKDCASRTAEEVEHAVTGQGGCAAAMRDPAQWRRHPQSRAIAELPLIGLRRLDDAPSEIGLTRLDIPASRSVGSGQDRTVSQAAEVTGRPLAGVRVLDLTRVIAGPVATRTLAAYGAEVLRVGAAHLPEVPGLVISTAFGKRSCELDLGTAEGAAAFRDLVAGADVVVQSYRPGALAALGFGPRELAAIRPGLVHVDISAYGSGGPWARRRGFDSLVQMACGIAHDGGDGSRPVPLPAQVLDHATAWLASLGALAGLLRRQAEGGSWHVEVSLARTALWLDGLGRVDGLDAGEPEVTSLLEEMDSPFGKLTYVRPPGAIGDTRPYWSSPPPRRGEHHPRWT